MKGLRHKIICAGAFLPVMFGCGRDISDRPKVKTEEKIERAAEDYTSKIVDLVERVKQLTKEVFPRGMIINNHVFDYGGVVYVGPILNRDTGETENEYTILGVRETSFSIYSCIGLDLELEKVIHEYLLKRGYGAAVEALKDSKLSVIGYDNYSDPDFIPYTLDSAVVISPEGRVTEFRGSFLHENRVIVWKAYIDILTRAEKALNKLQQQHHNPSLGNQKD